MGINIMDAVNIKKSADMIFYEAKTSDLTLLKLISKSLFSSISLHRIKYKSMKENSFFD